MFEPNMFLSFSDIKYNLHSDELILLQSLLTSDYFDNLVPDSKNKYISYNAYDTVEPNTTQIYDNEYTGLSKIINKTKKLIYKPDTEDEKNTNNRFKTFNNCPTFIKNIFSKFKPEFKANYKELEFSSETAECSFDVALTIVNNLISDPVTIIDIKNILIDEYSKLMIQYSKNIIQMLSLYGMNTESLKLSENNLSITHLIMNKDYYLTVLDILLLSNKYDIPIALLSSKHFKENNKEIMTLNTNKNEVFIIIVPLFYENMNNFPKYKMIIDKDMDGFIEIRNLPPSSIKTEIVEQKNSLENLIQNYTIEKQPLPITKKVKKLKLVE